MSSSVISVSRLPVSDPIARPRRKDLPPGMKDGLEGTITDPWIRYMQTLQTVVSAQPQRISLMELDTQGASIGATALPTPTLTEGLYRITWYAAITRAGSVSSSLTVTLAWTDRAIAKTYSGAAIVGNTTATVQSQTQMVRSDANSPITYATTYADGGGAVSMQYALDLVVELVSA
jgi:hypothetical protein